MEVVEVAPLLDHGSITTMNARHAIFEALTGLAMRKLASKDQTTSTPQPPAKSPSPWNSHLAFGHPQIPSASHPINPLHKPPRV